MTYCARPHCNGTMVKDELGVRCMLCGREDLRLWDSNGNVLPPTPAHDVIITDPKVKSSDITLEKWEEVPMSKPQRKAPRPASFFEAHKAEIIADYRTMGDAAMCAKWGLRGHWHRWRKKWGVQSNTELAENTKPQETDAIDALEEELVAIEKIADMLNAADATIHRLEDRVNELTESLERTEKQSRVWQAEYDKAAHQLKEAEKDRDGWKKLWAAEHDRCTHENGRPFSRADILNLCAQLIDTIEKYRA